MNIEQLIADLRSRVNLQYYDQIGTESYERNQCVLALESLMARIEVLSVQNAALRADADRIDHLRRTALCRGSGGRCLPGLDGPQQILCAG